MLVVWGTHDRVIPVEHAEHMRDTLPNAEVLLLDGIGHAPHLSQPAFVGERLAGWIRDSAAPVGCEVERPTSHA